MLGKILYSWGSTTSCNVRFSLSLGQGAVGINPRELDFSHEKQNQLLLNRCPEPLSSQRATNEPSVSEVRTRFGANHTPGPAPEP